MSRVRDAVIWNTSTVALHNDHWIQISINGHTFSQFIDRTQLILFILRIMKAESHIQSRCSGWKFSVHLEPRTQFLLALCTQSCTQQRSLVINRVIDGQSATIVLNSCCLFGEFDISRVQRVIHHWSQNETYQRWYQSGRRIWIV